MLELKGLTYQVGDNGGQTDILRGIDLTIQDNAFVVITGPNGGGKTTLAKTIMGLVKPTGGQILWNGTDITALSITERAKLGISYGFQQPPRFKGLKVRDLLAGIITMTALSSINLVLAGSNVTVERAVDTIFTSPLTMTLFGDLSLTTRKLILSLVLAVVIKLLLDLYFRTKSGLLLRATGDNGTLVTTLAQNKGNMKILGVVIANALVALCGAVVCQEQRSYSAVMGIGQVVFGLATVIIGISLIRFFTRSKAAQGLRKVPVLRVLATPKGTMAVLLGSIIYKFCVQIAISAGLPANMLKFITAALFLVVLVIAGRRGEEIIHA